MKIVFYITNHGYGHASRNVPIIKELLARSNTNQIWVKSDKIRCDFIRRNMTEYDNRLFYCEDCFDVGLILKEGTMILDETKTGERITEDLLLWDEYIAREKLFLNSVRPDIVVDDIVPWGIKAAKECSIPTLLISSFTWSQIYEEFFPESIWRPYFECYSMADSALWYDIHSESLHSLCNNYKLISLVSRQDDSIEIKKIKEKHDKPIVFVSVGGSVQISSPIDVGDLPYDFIVTQGISLSGANVTQLPPDAINTPDLIAASDYIISKGGWSTVAEIMLRHKKCALLFRSDNAEDRNTRSVLENRKHCISIEEKDLYDISSVICRINELEPTSYEVYRDDVSKICDVIESGSI